MTICQLDPTEHISQKCYLEYSISFNEWTIFRAPHVGLVTHTCVSGLSHQWLRKYAPPARCHAITWTGTDLLSTAHLWTNFYEFSIRTRWHSFTELLWRSSSAKCPQFCSVCSLLTNCGDINLGLHSLKEWRFAWRHQVITWTRIDLSSLIYTYIHLRAISQDKIQSLIGNIGLKISYLKFQSNLPGANELKNK